MKLRLLLGWDGNRLDLSEKETHIVVNSVKIHHIGHTYVIFNKHVSFFQNFKKLDSHIN